MRRSAVQHPPTRHPGWWGQDIVPRIQWRIEVGEGWEIPDGYGIAYYQPGFTYAVCIIEPLHILVGGWRAFRSAMRFPPWRHTEWLANRQRAAAWDAGFAAAQESCEGWMSIPRRNPYRESRWLANSASPSP